MGRIKVGVIGVGYLGSHHARIYSQLQEVELAGVYDINQEKSRKVAGDLSVKSYDSLESLLPEVKAVSIAVPTSAHFQVTRGVLQRKIDCLIEKPITQTVSQALELIKLAEKQNLILQVGHIERFNPAVLVLKDLEINLEPKFIETHRLVAFTERGTDVAVILDLMIHDIDLILAWVKSDIEDIQAAGISVISEADDIANARITFKNGCVANITASRISPKPMRKLRIFQKDLYLSLDLLDRSLEVYKLIPTTALNNPGLVEKNIVGKIPVEKIGKTVVYEKPKVENQDMLTLELKSFLDSVKNRTQPLVSGKEAKKALEVALEIEKKTQAHRKKLL
ncbi:MAG: Oxidoreductase protein [candidate division Zixibacteria bacterium RBG-1]|nr:MAG: Oxidoreductase protein [candidate division Zixibacteria bacterium RBG-1]OGC86605.1 MAG: hypothetical protein A2V73_07210 [candidate division Zixibacteria bacterium RBG_19FT_COMBO_42_43]